MNITQAVVEAESGVIQPLRGGIPSLISHASERFGEGVMVSHDHPAFASSHLFIRIERKAGGIAKGTCTATAIFGSKRLAGVFDHG